MRKKIWLPETFYIPEAILDAKLDLKQKFALSYILHRHRFFEGHMNRYTTSKNIAYLLKISHTTALAITSKLEDDGWIVYAQLKRVRRYFIAPITYENLISELPPSPVFTGKRKSKAIKL